MIRISKISVVATATTVAITGAVVVLTMMILAFLSTLLGGAGMMGMAFGGGLDIIIAPILYAAFVWLATALICVAYNAAASFTGGIGFRVERDDPPAPVAGIQEPPAASS